MTAVLCLSMTLAGCAGSGNVERQLPPAPSYLQPANVPEPKAGEACLSVAARERSGRLTNASIIQAVKGDWQTMTVTYTGKGQ